MSSPRSSALVLLALLSLGNGCSRRDPLALAEDLREERSPVLLAALARGPLARRERAALAMGRIQSAAYAEPLAAAARGERGALRLAALFALGQLGLAEGAKPPAVAVAACSEALADADPLVVASATEALGKLAAPDTAGLIARQLAHPVPAVRAEAATALLRLRFVPLWRKETDLPPELPEPARTALIGALADPEPDVRRAAAHACSRYGEVLALPQLAALVGDPDAFTRLYALRALGRSGSPAAAAALGPALVDPDAAVRAEALLAMAALGVTVEPRPELAADASFHVRAALARVLAAATGDASRQTLSTLAEDPSPSVVAEATRALARRLGEGYAATLRGRLGDARWPVRAAAAGAARELEAGRGALLAAALADPDGRVRVAALEAAGARGDWGIVRPALDSADLAERGTAVDAIAEGKPAEHRAWLEQAYLGSSGEPWIEIREAAIDALGKLEGSPGTTDLLLRAAERDPAASVRSRARLGLARLGVTPPASLPAAAAPSPWLDASVAPDPRVELETTRGRIEIRLLPERAPIHVASFVERVGAGFYDGLTWHRVVSNFVVQGGDPRGDGWGGGGVLLRDEIHPERFGRGAVGMPKAGKDTGGGQLFITLVPTPHLDGNYTLFGVVTSGMDAVERLEVGDQIVKARLLGS